MWSQMATGDYRLNGTGPFSRLPICHLYKENSTCLLACHMVPRGIFHANISRPLFYSQTILHFKNWPENGQCLHTLLNNCIENAEFSANVCHEHHIYQYIFLTWDEVNDRWTDRNAIAKQRARYIAHCRWSIQVFPPWAGCFCQHTPCGATLRQHANWSLGNATLSAGVNNHLRYIHKGLMPISRVTPLIWMHDQTILTQSADPM